MKQSRFSRLHVGNYAAAAVLLGTWIVAPVACSSDDSASFSSNEGGSDSDASAPKTAGKSGGSGGAAGTSGNSTGGQGGTGSDGSTDAGTAGSDAEHAGSGGSDETGSAGSGSSAGSSGSGSSGQNPTQEFDVTFFVVADTHANADRENDLLAMVRAINAVGKKGEWPEKIGGEETGFIGGRIAEPRGVVFAGDITGSGSTAPFSNELSMFKHYFEKGNSDESIAYPGYVGIGNHDVDRDDWFANIYRNTIWKYVEEQHSGDNAKVRTTSFHGPSRNYSWDWDRVHLIQTHRFAGDTGHDLGSSLDWLRDDLKRYASDGRPVFVFHHYGMDGFGTQDRWWTKSDRDAYRDRLKGYNLAAIIVGHSHAAMQYGWEGHHVFQVNNAKAENGTGNDDGNGSFGIVRITNSELNFVTCRWLDTAGKFELVAPYYSGKITSSR